MIGGQPRDAIAALNAADGSATTTFNPMPNNRLVLALAISGSTLYVGGYFTAIGGQPRNNIAALNASDGMATSFDPNATTNGCNACGGVSAIAVSSSARRSTRAGSSPTSAGRTGVTARRSMPRTAPPPPSILTPMAIFSGWRCRLMA